MQMRTQLNRLAWVDTAKGFAALLVVLGHNLKGMLEENLIASDAVLWMRTVNWVYSFHM